jgi:hypothetical protein
MKKKVRVHIPKYPHGGHTVKQRRGTRENYDGHSVWTPSGQFSRPSDVSSHLMKAEYVDGRGWVAFPSLFQDSKPYADDSRNWVDMSDEKDGWWPIYEEAEKRGEVYDFGEDKESAIAFGEGSWKNKKYGGIFEFDGGGIAGHPHPHPTHSDSLALYNNAILKDAFYRTGFYNELLPSDDDYKEDATDFQDRGVRLSIIDALDKPYKSQWHSRGTLSSPRGIKIGEDEISEFSFDSWEDEEGIEHPGYTVNRKSIGEKRFGDVPRTNLSSFGDIMNGKPDDYYNPDAPPIYLHPNISPQGSRQYLQDESTTKTHHQDHSQVPYYDPIAVKPGDMLTDDEVWERYDKYGSTGIPQDKLDKFNLKTRTKEEAIRLPVVIRPPKGTLDPKKSINVNLIKQGFASNTKTANAFKKKLWADVNPDEEYKGTAAQNTKLNSWIFDNEDKLAEFGKTGSTKAQVQETEVSTLTTRPLTNIPAAPVSTNGVDFTKPDNTTEFSTTKRYDKRTGKWVEGTDKGRGGDAQAEIERKRWEFTEKNKNPQNKRLGLYDSGVQQKKYGGIFEFDGGTQQAGKRKVRISLPKVR